MDQEAFRLTCPKGHEELVFVAMDRNQDYFYVCPTCVKEYPASFVKEKTETLHEIRLDGFKITCPQKHESGDVRFKIRLDFELDIIEGTYHCQECDIEYYVPVEDVELLRKYVLQE
ncbi:MAG: hypothetical protein ACTSRW_07355 [Candidatus Helarchaeota archaeon]